MKDDKKRVVIIDNQFAQFSRLSKTFKNNEYAIFPDVELFNVFMDNIKIIIDPRYQQKYRDECLIYIKRLINDYQPDVIVIDYVLGGSHVCETGVDLAPKIVDGTVPVLFVSIEDNKNKNIKEKLEEYKWMYDWSEKERFQWYSNTKNVVKEDFYSVNIIKNANKLIEMRQAIMTTVPHIIVCLNKLKQLNGIYSDRKFKIVLDEILDRITAISSNKKIPGSISDSETKEIALSLNDVLEWKITNYDDELWRKYSLFKDKLIIDA